MKKSLNHIAEKLSLHQTARLITAQRMALVPIEAIAGMRERIIQLEAEAEQRKSRDINRAQRLYNLERVTLRVVDNTGAWERRMGTRLAESLQYVLVMPGLIQPQTKEGWAHE